MHDPVGFLAVGGSPAVENQSLPHSNPPEVAVDDLVPPGRLPESSSRGAVRPCPGRVLFVLVAKEIPVVLRCRTYLAFLCSLS